MEQIYRSMSTKPELQKSTMSVAEKLIATGLATGLEKGRSQGYWFGRIESPQIVRRSPFLSVDLIFPRQQKNEPHSGSHHRVAMTSTVKPLR